MGVDPDSVRVYTVNGATAGSSSSLPDWLTRKRELKGKGRNKVKEHVEGAIELVQDFEFPEASNRVKTTRDGQHIIATGTYKPQMRVWDLDQLSLKFERHSDAENVDFVILSDDWTKTIHLQNDRTIELHTQGGFHYRTRIPRFGRSLAYHFPSCDAYFSAAGKEVYRLNLDQGRFMNPLDLQERDDGEILGVDVVDVNPAHQLLAFGVDGNGTAQFWDPRSRSIVGTLRLPRTRLVPIGAQIGTLSVTAIASRVDGLSYALGTSTGHTLLYDIRAANPFAVKDQGYGLNIKTLSWIEGGSRMAGDGMVLSADKKVIKIWDRSSPAANFTSITPTTDLNDVHHLPGSGLIMTANEGIQMSTYYIPQLGPAPRWASFLENITEEMEDQTTRSVYQDFKFVERNELKILGLDHLIGTPALKPYMHGYFISLKLYETARIIANPFSYDEYREKVVREKMEKMADRRIRTKKDAGVKVNKALAEKILRDEEKARKKAERKARHGQNREREKDGVDVDPEGLGEEEESTMTKPSVLSDPRFAKVFEDPAFAIDENSREFALLNPSAVAQRTSNGHPKTSFEEADSDSSFSHGSDSASESGDLENDSDICSTDSSKENGSDISSETKQPHGSKRKVRNPNVTFVPMRPQVGPSGQTRDANATFGQRRLTGSSQLSRHDQLASRKQDRGDAPMEISWVPSQPSGTNLQEAKELFSKAGKGKTKRKNVEGFGAGLEITEKEDVAIGESERHGRTQRRKGIRSGSKNAFRRL